MKILIRGAGDLATGIAAELWERGHQILMTDVAIPLTVRREVAFSRAVYEEHAVVEGIEAVLAENFEEAETIMATRKIAVMVDEKQKCGKNICRMYWLTGSWQKRILGPGSVTLLLLSVSDRALRQPETAIFVIETQRGEHLAR